MAVVTRTTLNISVEMLIYKANIYLLHNIIVYYANRIMHGSNNIGNIEMFQNIVG
jgi:hypothetical protein